MTDTHDKSQFFPKAVFCTDKMLCSKTQEQCFAFTLILLLCVFLSEILSVSIKVWQFCQSLKNEVLEESSQKNELKEKYI